MWLAVSGVFGGEREKISKWTPDDIVKLIGEVITGSLETQKLIATPPPRCIQ